MGILIIFLAICLFSWLSGSNSSNTTTNQKAYWHRSTVEPPKEEVLSKIEYLANAKVARYAELYYLMIDYNDTTERYYSMPDYDEEIKTFGKIRLSDLHIYFLRYQELDYIKQLCENRLIKSPYYSYKMNSTIDQDNDWRQYTNWYDRHRAYLATPQWQVKRKGALERANYKCQLCCNKNKLHVHHNTYDRLGNEAISDLIVLCEKCHSHHHGY